MSAAEVKENVVTKVGSKETFRIDLWTGDTIHVEREKNGPHIAHRIVTPIEALSGLSPEHLFEELRDVMDKIFSGEFFDEDAK